MKGRNKENLRESCEFNKLVLCHLNRKKGREWRVFDLIHEKLEKWRKWQGTLRIALGRRSHNQSLNSLMENHVRGIT